MGGEGLVTGVFAFRGLTRGRGGVRLATRARGAVQDRGWRSRTIGFFGSNRDSEPVCWTHFFGGCTSTNVGGLVTARLGRSRSLLHPVASRIH